jgi:hypothetical protein
MATDDDVTAALDAVEHFIETSAVVDGSPMYAGAYRPSATVKDRLHARAALVLVRAERDRSAEIIEGLRAQLGMLTDQCERAETERDTLRGRSAALETQRVCWMIECQDDGQPMWWTGQHGGSFTPNPDNAIQFARREDARSLARSSLAPSIAYTLTEHMFLLPPEGPR